MCVVVRTGGREWGWSRSLEDRRVRVAVVERVLGTEPLQMRTHGAFVHEPFE